MGDEGRAEYDRGHADGGNAERLDSHDKHFAMINGSLERMAREIHAMTMQIQRLGDQAISRDATVITTAAALKDAEAARRDLSTQHWSPWARLAAGVSALAGVIGIVATVVVIVR